MASPSGPELNPPSVPDYYGALGLSQSATMEEMRLARDARAFANDPATRSWKIASNDNKFFRAHEAYLFLRDASRRAEYDKTYPALLVEWEQYMSQRADISMANRRRLKEELLRHRAEMDALSSRNAKIEQPSSIPVTKEDKSSRAHKKRKCSAVLDNGRVGPYG